MTDHDLVADPDRLLEIRLYRLHEGARAGFHRLLTEEALPLLLGHGITVVDYGPSAIDETGYFLARAFPSLEHRKVQLDRFYGSEEWLTKYDEPIMSMIESYLTVVLPADSPLAVAVLADVGQRTSPQR